MTEKEAWRVCGMLWSYPAMSGELCQTVGRALGLCPTIRLLRNYGLISDATMSKMRTKIDRLPQHEIGGGFKFPTDRAGACARAEFCMKQYRKLGGK